MTKFANISYDLNEPCDVGHIFLTPTELEKDTVVVVETSQGLRLGKVTGMAKGIPDHLNPEKMRYVVDTVDMTKFNEVKKMSEERRALQLQMDLRAAAMDRDSVYEELAAKDDGMRELFDRYKALQL